MRLSTPGTVVVSGLTSHGLHRSRAYASPDPLPSRFYPLHLHVCRKARYRPAWLALVGRALHPPDDASVFLEGSAPPVLTDQHFLVAPWVTLWGGSWTVTWPRSAG